MKKKKTHKFFKEPYFKEKYKLKSEFYKKKTHFHPIEKVENKSPPFQRNRN